MKILIAFLLVALGHLAYADKAKTYSVKSSDEVHSMGLKRTPDSILNMLKMKHTSFSLYAFDQGGIPKLGDISSLVSPPENQGQCGACWDFSLTKSLRSEYMIAGKDPGVLEFNFLLNNCGRGPKLYGCRGGDFDAALSFQSGGGPGLNALNPYIAREGSCMNLPLKATAMSYSMLGDSSGPTFKDLAVAISQKHMVSIDVAAASGDWASYHSGVYNGCVHGQIDHMIDLVGYNCQTSVDASGNCAFDASGRAKNHDELLLVENNWGEQWGVKAANGHGGYMWTKMYGDDGHKCNAIANDALIFMIEQPKPPAPVPSPSPSPSCVCPKCS